MCLWCLCQWYGGCLFQVAFKVIVSSLGHISIGISRCLLGDEVRYDGRGKYSRICCEQLASYFQLVPICPEVEAGLPIPRPAVELIQAPYGVLIKGREECSLDVTHRLTTFCRHKTPSLTHLSGYVLTPRSPSCGVRSVTVKTTSGEIFKRGESGVFTQSLIQQFPFLPIIEEPELADKLTLLTFEIRVMMYYFIQCNHLSECIKAPATTVSDFVLQINALPTKQSQMRIANELLEGISFERLHKFKVELRDCVSSLAAM
ncbi:MAG TPA: DUF523 domain-containing protein [Cycloclasticus sp.]|nr:DUF523 domain-containing protein [Cycloclasticus sp.]HIM07231.1 DUF523 domain-containing protein [Gammaproteobacteria bacterium]